MEQEPGPRGSPQLPHDPVPKEGPKLVVAPTPNADHFFSNSVPWHTGHCGAIDLRTSVSNWCLQAWHMYSKIGMIRNSMETRGWYYRPHTRSPATDGKGEGMINEGKQFCL